VALRDLVRYQARSGAALAAVTLALGIAATVVVIASAEAAKVAAEPASPSDRQARVYLGPSEDRKLIPLDTPTRLDRLTAHRPLPCRHGHEDFLVLMEVCLWS
jgi:putative ABC transport system permease protein